MKRNLIFGLIFLLLFVILALLVHLVVQNGKKSNELTLYGNVDVRQVDISFRVAGKVEKLFFEEGDCVNEGTLLCTLEPSPYDSQLEEAIATASSVAVNLENAEMLFQRRQKLIGIGGVSQEDFDQARTNRDSLAANLVQAEAAVLVAQDNMSYTKSYAPTDGIILSRIREPGSVANAAEPVYNLSVSSPVWIRAFVDEPHLGEVYYGMEAEILTDTKRSYSGKVGFISPVAEFTPKTVQSTQLRTDLVYRLRIYADNPDRALVQGMPVTVKLHLKKGQGV